MLCIFRYRIFSVENYIFPQNYIFTPHQWLILLGIDEYTWVLSHTVSNLSMTCGLAWAYASGFQSEHCDLLEMSALKQWDHNAMLKTMEQRLGSVSRAPAYSSLSTSPPPWACYSCFRVLSSYHIVIIIGSDIITSHVIANDFWAQAQSQQLDGHDQTTGMCTNSKNLLLMKTRLTNYTICVTMMGKKNDPFSHICWGASCPVILWRCWYKWEMPL